EGELVLAGGGHDHLGQVATPVVLVSSASAAWITHGRNAAEGVVGKVCGLAVAGLDTADLTLSVALVVITSGAGALGDRGRTTYAVILRDNRQQAIGFPKGHAAGRRVELRAGETAFCGGGHAFACGVVGDNVRLPAISIKMHGLMQVVCTVVAIRFRDSSNTFQAA